MGLVAGAGRLLTRTEGLRLYRPSGILLIDFAGLGRYDMAVPVLGVLACLALGRADGGRRGAGWAALAGACGALAGLSHVYGWFWLAALAAALAHMGVRPRAWQWAAYQRPLIGAGWSINFVGGFDPFRADPNRTTSVHFAGLSVEKYFRNAPVGFGLRLDFPDQRDRGGIMPGISLYAPLLSMWRAQLTAMGGFEYALVGNGSGGSVHGPRFAGGANVDLVLGRVCCMVGTGFEYWFSPNAAIPHGPAILARFGFPF